MLYLSPVQSPALSIRPLYFLHLAACSGRKQFLRRYLGYDFRPPFLNPCPTLHEHPPHSNCTYTTTQMRRPPAKLCADCVPCAVRRTHGARVAPLPRNISETSLGMRPMAYSTLTRLPRRTELKPSVSANLIAVPVLQKRGLATAAEGVVQEEAVSETKPSDPPVDGPMGEYDVRVQEGRLRDDPYQRGEHGNTTTLKQRRSRLTRTQRRNHPEPPRPLRSTKALQCTRRHPPQRRITRPPTEEVLLRLIVRLRRQQACRFYGARGSTQGSVYVR